jgi:hypothetical protein
VHRYYFIIQNDIKMLQFINIFVIISSSSSFSCHSLCHSLFFIKILLSFSSINIFYFIPFLMKSYLWLNESWDSIEMMRYIRWCDYVMYTIPVLNEWIYFLNLHKQYEQFLWMWDCRLGLTWCLRWKPVCFVSYITRTLRH